MTKKSTSGPDSVKPEPTFRRPGTTGDADKFDRWLQRHLRQMFDSVASEPLPSALLKLLRGSRGKPEG